MAILLHRAGHPNKLMSFHFDRFTEKIAISITKFTLHKTSEPFWERYAEPCIVSLAVDSGGTAVPEIQFNALPFPKFRAGQTKTFHNHGHLVYGPRQPGEFAAYSLLFMESDQDDRDFGELLGRIVGSDTVKTLLKSVLIANPGWAAVLAGLETVTALVADEMKKARDDELFRTGGALLRDVAGGTPYGVFTSTLDSNDYIECETTVFPLAGGQHAGARGMRAPSFDRQATSADLFSTIRTQKL